MIADCQTRNPELGSPFRFGIDAQSIGEAIDVIEKACDVDDLEKCHVRESLPLQPLQVRSLHSRRVESQLDREIQNHGVLCGESGLPVISFDLLDLSQIHTCVMEILPMSFNSVEAVIRPGNHDCDHLALSPAEFSAFMHQRPVESH